MDDLVLTIDCGTQSLRVIIFNKKGEIIVEDKREFEPYFSLKPGWAEQNPEVYWNSALESMQVIKSKDPVSWKKIKALVVTTLRSTHVLMDKNGNVLRPSILWLDQRVSSINPNLNFFEKTLFSIVSMKNTLEIISSQSKANWIKENEPEIWAKTYKYMLVSGFFYYKLTGKFIDSTASQIGLIPFNYRKMDWEKSDNHWKFRAFGIERKKLYDLAKPTSLIGTITKNVSRLTDLPEGLPVIAGGSDKGCETVGNGCTNPECLSLSFGTTSTIQTTTSKYVEPIRFMPAYPAIIPNYYNPEVEIFRGYWMVSWFKKQFANEEISEARLKGVNVEDILNEKIKDIPPGSHGLILQPYWSPHMKTPEARGAILGFTDVHTKYHIYKSIIEGINYSLIEGMEKIIKNTKIKPKTIIVGGGGSQSNIICQITADMFGIPVKRVHTHEVSSLGAAMAGFVGLGVYSNFEVAINSMVKYTDTFYPNISNHKLYKKIYDKIYKKLYSKLKDFYSFIYKNSLFDES